MRRFEFQKAQPYRTAFSAAAPAVSGGLLFRWRDFGTGSGWPGAGYDRRRTDPLSDGLCPPKRRGGSDSKNCTVGAHNLFPLSIAGILLGICISWRAVAALCDGGIWLFLVLFCLLLYGGFRYEWSIIGAGGLWPALYSDTALLFSAGGSLLGNICRFSQSVLWERAAVCACGIWPGLLASACRMRSGAAGGRVCGIAGFAMVFTADVGTDLGMIQKRGRGFPWQKMILHAMVHFWRRKKVPPRTRSVPTCGMSHSLQNTCKTIRTVPFGKPRMKWSAII